MGEASERESMKEVGVSHVFAESVLAVQTGKAKLLPESTLEEQAPRKACARASSHLSTETSSMSETILSSMWSGKDLAPACPRIFGDILFNHIHVCLVCSFDGGHRAQNTFSTKSVQHKCRTATEHCSEMDTFQVHLILLV
jgi:hypothetical protein